MRRRVDLVSQGYPRRESTMACARTNGGQIPLMLIHRAWLSSRRWESVARLLRQSFAVSLPEWPRSTATTRSCARAQRGWPVSALTEAVDHYTTLLEGLDQPPVLIGHSFGGLIVELLLDRGLGRAGVAKSSTPPTGPHVQGRRPGSGAPVDVAGHRRYVRVWPLSSDGKTLVGVGDVDVVRALEVGEESAGARHGLAPRESQPSGKTGRRR